jgi:hypothetical protein
MRTVMLNAVKHLLIVVMLSASEASLEILRFAQNDRGRVSR